MFAHGTAGALSRLIRVRGEWLPRHLFFGRFTAFCAVCRYAIDWKTLDVGADVGGYVVPMHRLHYWIRGIVHLVSS